MMVADSIPVNSDISPLITQFLSSCRTIISAALIFNLVSLNVSGSRRVPEWLRRIAFHHVGPCVGYFRDTKHADKVFRLSLRKPTDDADATWEKSLFSSLSMDRNRSHATHRLTKYMTALLMKRMKRDKKRPKNGPSNEKTEPPRRSLSEEHADEESRRATYKQVRKGLNVLIKRSSNETGHKLTRDFWRCLAQTVDRMCLVFLGISFVFLTSAFLLKGYGHSMRVDMIKE